MLGRQDESHDPKCVTDRVYKTYVHKASSGDHGEEDNIFGNPIPSGLSARGPKVRVQAEASRSIMVVKDGRGQSRGFSRGRSLKGFLGNDVSKDN